MMSAGNKFDEKCERYKEITTATTKQETVHGGKKRDQNSQSASTDWIAHVNFSRSDFEKSFSIGTSNFLQKTTVRRGSM